MGNQFLLNSLDNAIRMHADGVDNYWFYHKNSFPYDAPDLYQYLMSNAKTSVEIWDPYINVGDKKIFSVVQIGVTIKILTTPRGQPDPKIYVSDFCNDLKMIIPKNKNIRFGIRVMSRGDVAHNGWIFHDRFLIIDRNEVYLIGSSIGWHLSSQESTGIFRVKDQETKDFILSVYDEYWKQANKYEIPVGFLHP